MAPQLLTVEQVAEYLAVSPATVRRRCAVGAIRCLDVGTAKRAVYRIPIDALDDLKHNPPTVERTPKESFGLGFPMLERFGAFDGN